MSDFESIKNALRDSQQRPFPREIREFGLNLVVREGVFSPEDFQSWRWFTENFPPFAGKTILEIGCGFGLPGLFFAKAGALSLVASDINPKAVANTFENAARNDLRNVEVVKSDIFSDIPAQRKFDIVFWNFPWKFVPEDFQYADDLERAAFDPGYGQLRRFLSEGPGFLAENGQILLGLGDNARDDLFEEIVTSSDLTSVMLRSGTYPNVKVTFRLFSISRNAPSL